MESKLPLVSIVIPCYDNGGDYAHSKYLNRALVSASDQGPDVEVIVVDDGSVCPDKIRDLAIKHNATILRHPVNLGASAARNFGIDMAHGEYILPFDCDDVLIPWSANRMRQAFLDYPEIDVVYGDIIRLGTDHPYWRPAASWTVHDMLMRDQIPACSMFKRKTFIAAGKYDCNIKCHMDWILWIDMAINKAKFLYIGSPIYMYRASDNGNDHLSTYSKAEHEATLEYMHSKYKQVNPSMELLNQFATITIGDSNGSLV